MAAKSREYIVAHRAAYGPEPDFDGVTPTEDELATAWTWYSQRYDSDERRAFIIEYLEIKNIKSEIIDLCLKAKDWKFKSTTGAMCAMLLNGAIIPEHHMQKLWADVSRVAKETRENKDEVPTIIRAPKDRIHKVLEVLEGKLDDWSIAGSSDFKIKEWIRDFGVTQAQAEKIVEHFSPLYLELEEAIEGKDADLKYAYSHMKPKKLQEYADFVGTFIDLEEIKESIPVVQRKPRKARRKKIKPAAVVVAKLNYKQSDEALKLTSIKPASIVGTGQLWIFNTKTRFLSVFYAKGTAGLNVKGSTVFDFDPKTSVMKKLRKPEKVLPEVLEGGKIALRKVMDSVNAVPQTPKGRINKDTILLRTVSG